MNALWTQLSKTVEQSYWNQWKEMRMRKHLAILKCHDGKPKRKQRNELKQTLSARPTSVFHLAKGSGLRAASVSSPCSFRSLSHRSPPKLCRISLLIWNSQCALTVSSCSFRFTVTNPRRFWFSLQFWGLQRFLQGSPGESDARGARLHDHLPGVRERLAFPAGQEKEDRGREGSCERVISPVRGSP